MNTLATLSSYFRNSALQITGRCVTYAFGALTVVAFARFTTPAVYGQFTFLATLFDIFIIVTYPGMATALVRSVARGFDGTVHEVARTRFKGGLVGSLLLAGCAFYYGVWGNNPSVALGTGVSAVIFPFHYAFVNYEYFLMGKKRFMEHTVFKTISIVAMKIVAVVALVLTRKAEVPFIASIVLGCLFAVWAYARVTKNVKSTIDPEAIPYGFQLTTLSGVSILANKLELIIVPIFFSFEQLAYFAIAERAANEFKFLWATVSNQMLTRLSELSPYDAYKKTVARLPLTLLAFAGLTAVSIAALPFAIPFVLSARYLPSVNLTQLMLAATFASLTGAYFETYLVSQRKTGELAALRFVFPVTFLGTLPLGAHYFGVLGIIFAKMIAGAVYSIVAVALARRVQLA